MYMYLCLSDEALNCADCQGSRPVIGSLKFKIEGHLQRNKLIHLLTTVICNMAGILQMRYKTQSNQSYLRHNNWPRSVCIIQAISIFSKVIFIYFVSFRSYEEWLRLLVFDWIFWYLNARNTCTFCLFPVNEIFCNFFFCT